MKKVDKKNMKSKGLFVCIIVSIISALIGLYFILFHNNGVVGVWTTKLNDTDSWLNFKNDGTVSFLVNSLEVSGKYEVKSNNEIYIDIELNGRKVLSDNFKYEIQQSFTEKKLKLITSNNEEKKYTQCKMPKLKPSSDFNPVDKIVGTWYNGEHDVEYTFTNDGIVKYKTSNIKNTLIYKADDKEITFIQKSNKRPMEQSIEYSFNGEKLVLNEIEYEKR